MKRFLFICICALLPNCGEEEANIMGKIQWRFNFGDWTDTSESRQDVFRACSNQPEGRYAGQDENPYPAISKVRVLIEDPNGQVPPSDQEHDCERGYGSNTINILSMARANYDITLEAKAADGSVLYRHTEENIDLSVFATHSYDLKSVTSETTFFTQYSGSHECPENVMTLRYYLYTPQAKSAEGGDIEPTYTNSESKACASGTSETIYVRGVPVDPEMGSNNKFNPTMYFIKVEALNSDNAVLYCGWSNHARAFRPGSNQNGNLTGNIDINHGACPN